MEREKEILPDGIIEQRIDRMTRDIDSRAFEYERTHENRFFPLTLHFMERQEKARKIAIRLVSAGWCPGPVGEKPVLDKYFKT
jgi:hypothetical protein